MEIYTLGVHAGMKNRIYDKTAAWKRIFSLVLCAVICFSLTPLSIYSVEENYDLPWLWPVPGSFSINCLDIYYGGGTHNQGQCVDIGANGYTGENRLDVVSATSGKVHYVVNKYSETGDRGSGYGNYVMILSGNVLVIYAHLQSVSCKYGDVIKAGDVIGKMGMTGNATGVHLHLQARLLGENYDSTTIYVFDKFTDNMHAVHHRFVAYFYQFPTSVKIGNRQIGDIGTDNNAFYLGGINVVKLFGHQHAIDDR